MVAALVWVSAELLLPGLLRTRFRSRLPAGSQMRRRTPIGSERTDPDGTTHRW